MHYTERTALWMWNRFESTNYPQNRCCCCILGNCSAVQLVVRGYILQIQIHFTICYQEFNMT